MANSKPASAVLDSSRCRRERLLWVPEMGLTRYNIFRFMVVAARKTAKLWSGQLQVAPDLPPAVSLSVSLHPGQRSLKMEIYPWLTEIKSIAGLNKSAFDIACSLFDLSFFTAYFPRLIK